jgi:3-dehydroquinate synthase
VSTPLRVDVALGDRSYPIHIGAGLLAQAGALIKPHLRGGKALVIADATVERLHGATLTTSLNDAGIVHAVTSFPAGEPSKSLATADAVWQVCAANKIDRSGAVIALGGGVSGDLAGFVAACWMRGITFIQVPTTLLAMVDSSVGGKTGVNSAAGKNLIGAFKQPSCVVIDPLLIATMDQREYRAGLAEVLKYGVIKDPAFFAWQEANAAALAKGDPAAVAHAVAESCRIKAWYVAEDETEQSVRAHLNYGHTFGHALERETKYTQYLHGEAVGIGMRMAADLAKRLGMLTEETLIPRQDALLEKFGLPMSHPTSDPVALAKVLTGHCGLDKKVAAGRMRFVVPTRMGEVVTREISDHAAVAAAFASALVPHP